MGKNNSKNLTPHYQKNFEELVPYFEAYNGRTKNLQAFYLEIIKVLEKNKGYAILADMYRYGLGVTPSRKKEDEYIVKCIQTNRDGDMALKIGDYYRDGILRKRDISKAEDFYDRATQLNHYKGYTSMGLLIQEYPTYFARSPHNYYRRDTNLMAMENFAKAHEYGDPEGTFYLGMCYFNGKGVRRDEKGAFELFQQSAKGGYVPAYVNIGDCYRQGNGVEMNPQKAFQCYKRAEELGYDPEVIKKKLSRFTAEQQRIMDLQIKLEEKENKIEELKKGKEGEREVSDEVNEKNGKKEENKKSNETNTTDVEPGKKEEEGVVTCQEDIEPSAPEEN